MVGHLAIDVGPERIAYPLALLESGNHPVEAGLEEPDLTSVVHDELLVEVTLLHAPDRLGHAVDGLGDGAGSGCGQHGSGEETRGDEERHRPDQLVAAHLAPPEEGDGYREQRHAGSERPRDQEPGRSAQALRRTASRSRRGVSGEGQREERAQRTLDEQKGDPGGGEAGVRSTTSLLAGGGFGGATAVRYT